MKEVYKAVENLVNALGDKIVAISLFGSRARGENLEYSDYDFFIVVKNFEVEDRRFLLYHYLYEVLKHDITIVDMDYEKLFREDLIITPLLLNIAWDSIILYDPTNKLRELFNRIKERVREKLVRYKTKDGKYGWKPRDGKLTTIEV